MFSVPSHEATLFIQWEAPGEELASPQKTQQLQAVLAAEGGPT